MNKQTASQPILCIDLKKNRIRIHKLTLHKLGDPEYIQLLVNPTARMIAIRCSNREDNLAHHIRSYQLTDGNTGRDRLPCQAEAALRYADQCQRTRPGNH